MTEQKIESLCALYGTCLLYTSKRDAELLADRIDDRADQQRAEQTLRHRTKRVDAIPFDRYFNVLSFEKFLYLVHVIPSLPRLPSVKHSVKTAHDTV